MALEQWALPKLSELLPLDEQSLKDIVIYTKSLPDLQAAEHLTGLLGDSPQAFEFIESFNAHRAAAAPPVAMSTHPNDSKHSAPHDSHDSVPRDSKGSAPHDSKGSAPPGQKVPDDAPPSYAPSHPPPAQDMRQVSRRPHTNPVIVAGQIRARDEVSSARAL
jgi:hypothetical protein